MAMKLGENHMDIVLQIDRTVQYFAMLGQQMPEYQVLVAIVMVCPTSTTPRGRYWTPKADSEPGGNGHYATVQGIRSQEEIWRHGIGGIHWKAGHIAPQCRRMNHSRNILPVVHTAVRKMTKPRIVG